MANLSGVTEVDGIPLAPRGDDYRSGMFSIKSEPTEAEEECGRELWDEPHRSDPLRLEYEKWFIGWPDAEWDPTIKF